MQPRAQDWHKNQESKSVPEFDEHCIVRVVLTIKSWKHLEHVNIDQLRFFQDKPIQAIREDLKTKVSSTLFIAAILTNLDYYQGPSAFWSLFAQCLKELNDRCQHSFEKLYNVKAEFLEVTTALFPETYCYYVLSKYLTVS